MAILNGYGGEKAFKQAEAQRRIAERKYQSTLGRLVRDLGDIVKKHKTPGAIIQAIKQYIASGKLNSFAKVTAERMVTQALAGQKRTWREAAAESSRGRDIYEALKEETGSPAMAKAISDILDRNATLIKTVPQTVANRLSKLAWEMAQKGRRPEEIAKTMQQMCPGLTKTQIKRIARTETAKAQSALMQARCEDMGLDMYIWRTAKDGRVRDAHAEMDGVLCRWSDPPNPEAMFGGYNSGNGYPPGGIYNCRCVALPVVDDRDLHFPLRVHKGGSVQPVNNKAELEKVLSGRAKEKR